MALGLSFMKHFPHIIIIIAVALALYAGKAAAQSRYPEIKIAPAVKEAKKAASDSTGYEERPYFLLIDQCEKAMAEHDYEAAGLRLVEAMAVEPDNPLNVALLANLGMIYYYNEQDSMALVTLDHVIQRSPRLLAGHENRARVLTGMGRDREAFEEYGKVIELDSINADARFYHGMMALYGGDMRTAEADFATLQRVVPLWSNTTLALATLYSMTGRDREAIPLFRKLLETDKYAEYYAALAGCLLATDNHTEASKVIGEGLERYPKDPELYYYRAMLNHLRFMEDEAQRDARTAIQLGASPQKVARIFGGRK